ncbi:MAG TPA: DUF2339 domain-containing protein [Allosphingosinicella sp.]|jgi:uncharacterized membrane protein
MDFLLSIGLLLLGAHVWTLTGRVRTLERALREGRRVEPEAELRPLPARIVRNDPPPELAEDMAAARAAAFASRQGAADARRSLIDSPPVDSPQAPPFEPRASAPEESPETLGGVFERLVGGRLLIWIGGIALALSGLFLVRYSIQIGLITPAIRMLMATAFGLVLIGAGEVARRRPDAAIDPRVAQALVGAGILVLYAAAYGSHVLYGLVGLRAASALMVAVTLAALALALRHGAPAAVMGLAGGFLTPVLVGQGSENSIPLLTYLALLNAALFALAARRGWTWLAASAVVLSFVWTLLLAFLAPAHALPAGVFILVLSLAASLLRAGGGWHLDFLRPAAIGLAELSILVGRTDLGLPAWALFAALAAATFFLAPRKAEYRPLPALALGLALGLLFLKSARPEVDPLLPWIAGGITLLFAAGALPGALRGSARALPTAIFCAAFAAPVLILRLVEPSLLARPGWGLLLAATAIGPLFLAWRRSAEQSREVHGDLLVLPATSALLLLAFAAFDLLPSNLLAAGWLVLALAAAFAARRFNSRGVADLAFCALVAAAMWASAMVPDLWETAVSALAGFPARASALPSPGETLLVLGLPVPLLVLLWRLAPLGSRRRFVPITIAGLFAGACFYVLWKQVFAIADDVEFTDYGFAERTVVNQALFLLGWVVCAGRVAIPGLPAGQRRLLGLTLTGLAAARLVWFDMLIHNPLLADQNVGALPVLNLILPAFFLSAFWLYKGRHAAERGRRSGLWLGLFLGAVIVGTGLIVRQGFHGAILTGLDLSGAESYGYSLAGLLLSIALLLAGFRLPDKALRLAGLALLTATICKVFLLDAAALDGLLRILSFLPLGVALIGIGKLYGTVLRAEAPAARTAQP